MWPLKQDIDFDGFETDMVSNVDGPYRMFRNELRSSDPFRHCSKKWGSTSMRIPPILLCPQNDMNERIDDDGGPFAMLWYCQEHEQHGEWILMSLLIDHKDRAAAGGINTAKPGGAACFVRSGERRPVRGTPMQTRPCSPGASFVVHASCLPASI